METAFWTQELQEKLKTDSEIQKIYEHWGMYLYLFGSATRSDSPHDLDIAILYNQAYMKEAQRIRDLTLQSIRAFFKGPLDCVLLSYDEEEQIHFLEKERAKLILPIYK